jgi:hypothetical protein
MELIKHAVLTGIDKIVQRKHDLAYVTQNQLVLQNQCAIDLPEKCYVVGEQAADFKVYLYEDGIGHVYYLNDADSFELFHPQKALSGWVLSSSQILLNYLDGVENTDTYFKDGEIVWQKEQAKRLLGNNTKTIVTSPNFKMTQLEVRDLATFTVQQVIDTDKNYKVSHHTNVIDDTLIFFQTRRLPEFTHIDVIATAINLTDGSIQWTSAYQGAYWFLFNDSDKQLYSLTGGWVNKQKTYYLETLNPKTGETSRTLLEQNTDIVTSPWLAKIVNNTLFHADSGTKGTCISAIDLTTKKRIARCDLHLAAGVKIAEPYIAGDDLWVLDTEKTLHQLTISS